MTTLSRAILAGVCVGILVSAPRADEAACPADRPHARRMTDYTPVICTLGCLGRLVCGAETCVRVQTGCNTCSTPPVIAICLSDEELREAEKPGVDRGMPR